MAGWVPPELARRLPGLTTALDGGAAATSVQRLLVAPGTTVLSADVHSIWVRDDGTCSLRYRVWVAQSSGVSAEHVVLARVHPDQASAAAYVARKVLPLRSGTDRAPGYPWRTHAAVWDDAGVGMHPFPLDPTLPTLPQAMDRARIGRLLDPSGQLPDPTVHVVRHARDGACVLGYGNDAEAGPRAYGKVYPDHTGRAVSAFLGAVSRSGLAGESGSVALPRPLAYDAAARLLITSAVPGAPGGLAKALGESEAGPRDSRSGTAAFRAHALLADCGRVLAAFHALPGSIAALHPLSAEEDTVRAALNQVAPVWPSTAVELTRHLSRLVEDVGTAEPPVLCHGDFTPAQVLVEDGVIRGLVDFDTVCWADPALDVGRFLAHVDLAVAKATGEPDGTAGEPFANSVLRGYLDAAPGAFEGRASPVPRIAAYRALSLARSALRACRQLKSTRADLALSVLRTADSWMKGVSP